MKKIINKKINIIIFIILFCIILLLGIYIILNNKDKSFNKNTTYNVEKKDEVYEIIENTEIQGIVELKHNGYIYIFGGQHFGEYGFEMQEYTTANIDNNNQKCIDYITGEEYDTNYIKEGDVLFCNGDLIKKSLSDNQFDTKNNPIIVLKSKDYSNIINKTLSNPEIAVITIGDFYKSSGEVYLKYSIDNTSYSNKIYKIVFAIKAINSDNTQILGELKKGNKVKVEYENLNKEFNKFELKSIKVIED